MTLRAALLRTLPRVAVVGALALALTGCVKLDLDLDVRSDDTVDGTVVLGFSKQLAGLPGLDAGDLTSDGPIDIPDQGRVTTERYDDGDFVGTRFGFTDVPLAEFGDRDRADDLRIVRDGDQFRVSGTLDLGADNAPRDTGGLGLDRLASGAEIRIRLTFPGDVVSANGTVDGRSVTWSPEFGETVELEAVAGATGRGSTSTLLLATGLLVGLALVAGFLYSVTRGTAGAPVEPPVPDGEQLTRRSSSALGVACGGCG